MEARQRTTRPVIRRPYPAAGKKRSEDDVSSDEDQKAGRGLVYLLGVVAIAVVILIAVRSTDIGGGRRRSPASPAVPDRPDSKARNSAGDIRPLNTLQDSEDLRQLVENEQNAIKESYPIELLADGNGTAAEPSDEEESEEERQVEEQEKEMRSSKHQNPIVKERESGSSSSSESSSKQTPKRIPSLGNFLFSDAEEYERASPIRLPDDPSVGMPFTGMWKLLTVHEQFFRSHEHRRHIPHLAQTITRQQFHEVFRKTSTPVIIPFEHARALGFVTQATTIEALQKRFPYDPNTASSSAKFYNKYSLTRSTVDWGPAVYAIANDAKLEKPALGVRNYPRNLHMSSKNLAAMGVSRPPFVQKQRLQAASAWFGTTTSDTKFHHDCCDNFVMMIVGVKRWFIAPPTDWRTLRPVRCEGDNQSLCWANVPYPASTTLTADQKRVVEALNSVVIELKAGEMLYLPAGWWHHITNLGPTVMMNHWTYGCENVALQLDLEPTRKDRPDFKNCDRNAREEQIWRTRMDTEDFGAANSATTKL